MVKYFYEIIHFILEGEGTEKYTKIILEILNLEGSPTYLYLIGNSLLLRILSYLIHDINFSAKIFEKTSPADDLRFFLDMHYAEKFQLRDVANNLGFEDAFVFSKKFHEVYKISPTKYREQK